MNPCKYSVEVGGICYGCLLLKKKKRGGRKLKRNPNPPPCYAKI